MISTREALTRLERLHNGELRDLFRELLQAYRAGLDVRFSIRDNLDQLVATWHHKTGVRPSVLYVWFLFNAVQDAKAAGLVQGGGSAIDKINRALGPAEVQNFKGSTDLGLSKPNPGL